MFSLYDKIPFLKFTLESAGIRAEVFWPIVYFVLLVVVLYCAFRGGKWAIFAWWPAVLMCLPGAFYVLIIIGRGFKFGSGLEAMGFFYSFLFSIPLILLLFALFKWRPHTDWKKPFPWLVLAFYIIMLTGAALVEETNNSVKLHLTIVDANGEPLPGVQIKQMDRSHNVIASEKITNNTGTIVLPWSQRRGLLVSLKHPVYGQHEVSFSSKHRYTSLDGGLSVFHKWSTKIDGDYLVVEDSYAERVPPDRDVKMTISLRPNDSPQYFRIVARRGDGLDTPELLVSNSVLTQFAPQLAVVTEVEGEASFPALDDTTILWSSNYRNILSRLRILADNYNRHINGKNFGMEERVANLNALHYWATGQKGKSIPKGKAIIINGYHTTEDYYDYQQNRDRKLNDIARKIDELATPALVRLKPYLTTNPEAVKTAMCMGRLLQPLLADYPQLLLNASPVMQKELLNLLSKMKLPEDRVKALRAEYEDYLSKNARQPELPNKSPS